jgi:hypothetical protein
VISVINAVREIGLVLRNWVDLLPMKFILGRLQKEAFIRASVHGPK